jgi:hypothetical protein
MSLHPAFFHRLDPPPCALVTEMLVKPHSAQQLARLCVKSGRWGPVHLRLGGLTQKWGQSTLQARDPGVQWERDSRSWTSRSGSR